ncbi:methyl-accepting chemotaxis protein [Pseudomonas sp. NCCP-436]|uniref:methyl-accepting chemotaxis protein n=1 Tax=Pseudomonas sp. NCCP-436 TaxID=2842481 RepID=UPI001C7FEED4|nr:methyl-accepting chemotaxis protein [Pseudomonas sp. NCCP-436]GIZ11280.1 methyl-accepting chemotaxis protein PctA [Pseudomonas sp. NCCP-436]
MTKNLQFRHKILLAASLVVVTAFTLFSLYNDVLQRNAIRDDLESYLREMGDVTSSNISNWLSGRILLVENTAEAISHDGGEATAKRALGHKSLTSTFTSIYLGTTSGSFYQYPADDLPADYDPRKRPWYSAAQQAGGSTLTEPYVDAGTGALTVTIATPADSVGIVGGDLSLKTLIEILSTLKLDGIGYAFLVSQDGTVLVHPDQSLVMKNLKEVFAQNSPTIDNSISEVNYNGQSRIYTFSRITGLPSVNWYVGLSVDKASAYSMLTEFRASAIIATIIAVILIIALLGVLIRALMQPLHAMGRAMEDIAQGEGDLTKRLSIQSNDEFGALGNAFNRFVERIHGSIREVSQATAKVNEVAKLVLGASNSSMANSDEQASRTNSVAAAINQLGAAAQEIARNAAEASKQATDARHEAEDGGQVVQQAIRSMNELSQKISDACNKIENLNSKTVDIGQILEVIKSISQQTNLLALNAAIEAARAGEAGRGFAVVADEVRNLAHRTQESAQEIETMIEELQVGSRESVTTMTESQRYSEDSVNIANQAGERLGTVTARIGEIDGMNQSVATATEEQTSVIESLNMDITEINTLNQEGVENLQATLRACADLEQQAERLKQLVDSFRI